MSKTCPVCHKSIFNDNLSTVVGIKDYCSCNAQVNYLHVERDSHFFTTLQQILELVTAREDTAYISIGLTNSIKNGYKIAHKDELVSDVLPGYKIIKDIKVVPYQLCPRCDGSGKITNINTTTLFSTCDVCNGAKVIPQAIL